MTTSRCSSTTASPLKLEGKSKKSKPFLEYRVPREVEPHAIKLFLEALDCPRALTVLILYENKEYEQLANLDFSPHLYSHRDAMASAYYATSLLSKYQDFVIPEIDREKAAFQKFLECESTCRSTNKRFRNLSCDTLYTGATVWLHDAVRRKISEILGVFTFEEFLDCADWGPGATTLLKGDSSCAENKFQNENGITRDLFSYLTLNDGTLALERFSPLWGQQLSTHQPSYSFQVGNKLAFVPKNSKIDRPIAIEPGLNLWFQKAVGQMIRRRLRKCGVDLSDQTVNQSLALSGSIDNGLCTVDFSSASDMFSRRLVEDLLPPAWYLLMDSCRSHFGYINGSPTLWEKFSSMGNGFTFELESLVFFAMSICCMEYQNIPVSVARNISVYGDDVIIPRESFQLFSALSAFYGFKINQEKTFVNSDFRESCGEHYYRGVCVTPIYLKGRLNAVSDLYRFYNSVRRLARTVAGNFSYCDVRFRTCCNYLRSRVPKSLDYRIPNSLGDSGFISNLDEATPSRARYGIEGYIVRGLTKVSIPLAFEGEGLLLNSLWGLERKTGRINPVAVGDVAVNFALGNFAYRRGYYRVKITTMIVRSWEDLGPWF